MVHKHCWKKGQVFNAEDRVHKSAGLAILHKFFFLLCKMEGITKKLHLAPSTQY